MNQKTPNDFNPFLRAILFMLNIFISVCFSFSQQSEKAAEKKTHNPNEKPFAFVAIN